MEADKILVDLIRGNQRFATGASEHPFQSADIRQSLVASQHPSSVILCCSDSRVPPELVFDAGLGELFTIRVAGNLVDDMVLASIEFAVAELGVRLLVVLGHERCGALQAALERRAFPSNHLSELIMRVEPHLEELPAHALRDHLLSEAAIVNSQKVAQEIVSGSEVVSRAISNGKLKIATALYHLESGKVEVSSLIDHSTKITPDQKAA